jgi:hypothetical protein
MQVLLNIPDAKAPFLMDVLQHISYVKVKLLTDEKALLLQEIKEAVDAVNLVKKGKLSARPAQELLNEI